MRSGTLTVSLSPQWPGDDCELLASSCYAVDGRAAVSAFRRAVASGAVQHIPHNVDCGVPL